MKWKKKVQLSFAAIGGLSSIGISSDGIAKPVQLVVQPGPDQAAGMIRGLQIVVSQNQGSELRLLTSEPSEDGRIQLAFAIANNSSQAVNIGPENITVSNLTLLSYDTLMEEQRKREGRKKFWNGVASFGNIWAASDAGYSSSSIHFSGSTNYGTQFSGHGSVSTYNGYAAFQAQALASVQNQARTEQMFQSFAQARSNLQANLRTTTLIPAQQIQSVLTFDVPKALRKAAASQPFSITVQVGSERHVLNGFVGPVGTLPAIAPPTAATLALASSPAPAPANAIPRTVHAPPRSAGVASSAVAGVTIEGYGRGLYRGQPEPLGLLAKKGYAPAQDELGSLYQMGKGVPQNNAEAVRLYKLAAAQGYASARSNLAWMYENGLGVKRDIMAAKRYYQQAAEQGDEVAKERLIELGRQRS